MEPRRWKPALAVLWPVLTTCLALWLLEASRVSGPVPVRDLPNSAPTRLVVFWIDSLADREALQRDLLPRMHERIARDGALHGPARACADAVSVPCFTAMITGVDRFSVFALGKNFGAREGALDGSVLRALQQRGKRIGYVGVPMFEHVLSGLESVSIQRNARDLPTIASAPERLERERLDLLIVHLHETDDFAHRLGPDSATYQDTLRAIDAAIDRAIARLRPTDHVVIMGDHGHTADGRHFAGLDVPTYAAVFGPLTRRTLLRPMAVSDFGAIWARLLGLSFGPHSWVDDYFDQKPMPSQATLPDLPSGTPTPLWAALSCVLLSLLAAWPPALGAWSAPVKNRVLAVAAVAFAIMLLLGGSWTDVRPFISFMPLWKCVAIVLATGVLLLAMVRSVRLTNHLSVGGFEIAFLGAVLLSVPTIYKYGGTFAILTWLGLALVVAAARAFVSGRRACAAAIVALWVPLYTLYNPAVRNFSVRWFPVYSEWIPRYAGLASFAWVLVAFAVPPHERSLRTPMLRAALVGLTLASLYRWMPAWVFAVPCALAFPMCCLAMRRVRWAPWAVALSIPALGFFGEGDASALAPVAAALVLWAAVPRAVRSGSPLLRSLVLVALVAATFWASMGARLTGVTFNFFFAWLPSDVPVTSTWLPHAVLTLFKYALPVALGLVLARHTAGANLFEVVPYVEAISRAKLGLVLAFLSAFAYRSHDAGPFLTADVVQEVALWLIFVALSACLPRAASAGEARAVPARQPPRNLAHAMLSESLTDMGSKRT